jgi:hypothetical protein
VSGRLQPLDHFSTIRKDLRLKCQLKRASVVRRASKTRLPHRVSEVLVFRHVLRAVFWQMNFVLMSW